MNATNSETIIWTCNSTGSIEEIADRFGLEFFSSPKRQVDRKTVKTISETPGSVVVQFRLKGGIKTYQLTGRAPDYWQVEVMN